MAARTINVSIYTYKRVVSEARKQLAMGSEIEALIEAAGKLRDLDPESPLVWDMCGRPLRCKKNLGMERRVVGCCHVSGL